MTHAIVHEWRHGNFTISTDAEKLDLAVVHGFLTASYWARGIPLEVVERSIGGSLPFGLYHSDRQIGFARVISDFATYAYIGDVFVLEEYRGQGLGTWLMETVVACPELQGLRRWTLATRDAQALYLKVGFTPLHSPDRWMERWFPDVYQEDS